MKRSLPPQGSDLPLGEPDEFSLTRAIVQERKQARAAAISQLRGFAEGGPVSSLSNIASWLPHLSIWRRMKMGDSVIQMEYDHGEWS